MRDTVVTLRINVNTRGYKLHLPEHENQVFERTQKILTIHRQKPIAIAPDAST